MTKKILLPKKSSISALLALLTTGAFSAALTLTLALGLALGGGIADSHAEDETGHFKTMLVFGDSLLDSGNIPVTVTLPSPVTAGLVFTNPIILGGVESPGHVAPDFLARHLGLVAEPRAAGGSNYAVADSNAEDIYAAITLYTAANRIDEKSLILMNGGANNLTVAQNIVIARALPDNSFAGLPAAGRYLQDVATTMRMAMLTLHAAGAKYIMVQNMPNAAFLPGNYDDASQPGAADLAGMFSNTYNTALSANINAARASGANIIVADIRGFFDHVIGNLDVYGFALTTDAQYKTCYGYDPTTLPGNDPACTTNAEHGRGMAGDNPNALLFADNVHPTQRFHSMAADYLYDITRAPTEIALLPEIALHDLRRQFAAAANFLHPGHNTFVSARDCFTDLQFGKTWLGDNGPAASGTIDGIGLSAGCAFSRAGFRVGFAGSASSGGLRADASGSEYDYTAVGGTGYASYTRDKYFAHVLGGVSKSDMDAQRRYRIGGAPFSASSDDGALFAWGAEIFGGAKFAMREDLDLSPVVGLSYKTSKSDAFSESGAGASNYRWHDFDSASSIARAGIIADYSGEMAGFNKSIRGEFFLAREGEDDLRQVTASRANDDPNNTYTLPGLQREAEIFYQMRIAFTRQSETGVLGLSWNHSAQNDKSHLFSLNYRRSF